MQLINSVKDDFVDSGGFRLALSTEEKAEWT